VREKVFFNLLDCMDINLASDAKSKILQRYSSKEKPIVVFYERAIRYLTLQTKDKQAVEKDEQTKLLWDIKDNLDASNPRN
jgi:hypothetical protein